MKNVDKVSVAKYLFLMASVLPVAKSAQASNKNSEVLPSKGEYTLVFSAGFEHLLPSRIVNSQINAKDLEGFCPGFFVEAGFANWSGQHGNSNYEIHIGFTGRFDYHNFNSRAYNIKDALNVYYRDLQPYPWVDPSNYGCAHVHDFINTLNINTGFGWAGFVFDVNAGAGIHFDTHNNWGPVIALGGGLGYRFDENFKLDAKWRLNLFPCENFNRPYSATNPGIRNSIEIGLTYKLKSFQKDVQKHKNGKHR
jgi:opacity protein-like surface antigen